MAIGPPAQQTSAMRAMRCMCLAARGLILEPVSADINSSGSQGEIEASSVSATSMSTMRAHRQREAVWGRCMPPGYGESPHETGDGELRVEKSGDVEATPSAANSMVGEFSRRISRRDSQRGRPVHRTHRAVGRYSFESHSGTSVLNIPRVRVRSSASRHSRRPVDRFQVTLRQRYEEESCGFYDR